MPKPELALSVQQPWAWLLVHGVKDCENRTWPLPRSMWGKRVYVHAGKNYDLMGRAKILDSDILLRSEMWRVEQEALRVCGGLVGEITFTRSVLEYDSPWASGPHIWLVADPVVYDRMIPCKGRLGFFKLETPR